MAIARKTYDSPFVVLPVRMPRETYGVCRGRKCDGPERGRWTLLGNGLCQSCYDKREAPTAQTLATLARQDRVVELDKKGMSIKEIAGLLGVHWRTVLRDLKGMR